MSNLSSNAFQTDRSTNVEEISEDPTNKELITSELPHNFERNGETFLNVQVPSCRNFALGDSQRRFDWQGGLPEREALFSQRTEELKNCEDKTEPFSLDKENSLESKPIFSEFIEELLFESTPLYDDDVGIFTDAEQDGEAQSKMISKTPPYCKNISTTLKMLIENLEVLSKSLSSNAKSPPKRTNRLPQKEPEATSKHQPDRGNPKINMASSILPLLNTNQLDLCSTLPIWSPRQFHHFLNPTVRYQPNGITSGLITASLKAIGPNPMLVIANKSDPNTPPEIPLIPMERKKSAENRLMEQSAENFVAEPALHDGLPGSINPDDAHPSKNCTSSELTSTASTSLHQSSVQSQLHADALQPTVEERRDQQQQQQQLHADELSSIPESSPGMTLPCLINFGPSCDQIVLLTARKFGFKQSSENWDILWVNRDPTFNKLTVVQTIELYKNLKSHQRINHFPGSWGLGLKDLLAKNLNYMYKYFPCDYSFFPDTWILPTQSLDLAKYMSCHPGSYFIIKPTHPSSGYEIKVTNEVHENELSCENVCQLYLKPFLIDGYKFDFRVYALVTSCDPLRIFVHREGLARFATEKYEEPAPENLERMFMHLTNTRVNVRNPTYVHDELCGSLRRISRIFQWLRFKNINVQNIQASMDDAIIKTIISNLATLKDYYQICFPFHSFSSACFEILGFDIMLDDQLKLFLLDVDCSPSFNCEGGDPFETELKMAILSDVFTITNLSESKRNQRPDDRAGSRRVTLLETLMRRKQEISAARRQFDWEDSHLGGFRKIYPPEACWKAKYYQDLIGTALRNPNIV